jgi:hypothetical protein
VDGGGPDGPAAATAGAGVLFAVLFPVPPFERIRTTATVPATKTTTITVTMNSDVVNGARACGAGGGSNCGVGVPLGLTGYDATAACWAYPWDA